MKSFADLIQEGVVKDVAASSYSCKRVPIDDIAGKSIVILGIVENIKTEKGEGRTLVHFKNFFVYIKLVCILRRNKSAKTI